MRSRCGLAPQELYAGPEVTPWPRVGRRTGELPLATPTEANAVFAELCRRGDRPTRTAGLAHARPVKNHPAGMVLKVIMPEDFRCPVLLSPPRSPPGYQVLVRGHDPFIIFPSTLAGPEARVMAIGGLEPPT